MATMNQPIMLLLTVIQIWNKYLKSQLNRVVYLCLCNICTKFQVDTSFLSWVLFNNLTSICSIWQRPWNHSTNIFIRIFFIASYTLFNDDLCHKFLTNLAFLSSCFLCIILSTIGCHLDGLHMLSQKQVRYDFEIWTFNKRAYLLMTTLEWILLQLKPVNRNSFKGDFL